MLKQYFIYTIQGFWNDDVCTFEFRFVCSKLPGGRTPIPPVTQPPRVGNCPSGWTKLNDRCFMISGIQASGQDPGPVNWTMARAYCERQNIPGADIGAIFNDHENCENFSFN